MTLCFADREPGPAYLGYLGKAGKVSEVELAVFPLRRGTTL
jgi:hypothetical protein